jgi:hypothetical protein
MVMLFWVLSIQCVMKWKPVSTALLLACLTVRAESYLDIEDLKAMTQPELDNLYEQSQAGPIPDGKSQGVALFFPGSAWEDAVALFLHFFWQGKIFDLKDQMVINEVVGFYGVKGTLSYGKSQLDGNTSILISYRRGTVFFRGVTDELREVGPNLYLGRAYERTWKEGDGDEEFWANFALQF